MSTHDLRRVRHLAVLMLAIVAAISAEGASSAHLITLGCLIVAAAVGFYVEMLGAQQ